MIHFLQKFFWIRGFSYSFNNRKKIFFRYRFFQLQVSLLPPLPARFARWPNFILSPHIWRTLKKKLKINLFYFFFIFCHCLTCKKMKKIRIMKLSFLKISSFYFLGVNRKSSHHQIFLKISKMTFQKMFYKIKKKQ